MPSQPAADARSSTAAADAAAASAAAAGGGVKFKEPSCKAKEEPSFKAKETATAGPGAAFSSGSVLGTVTGNAVAEMFIGHVQRAADTDIGERMLCMLDSTDSKEVQQPSINAKNQAKASFGGKLAGTGAPKGSAASSRPGGSKGGAYSDRKGSPSDKTRPNGSPARQTAAEKKAAADAATIVHEPTEPDKCLVTGDGLRTGMAKQLSTFTIVARTKDGNKRTTGGDLFLISVRGASTVKPRLADHGDGVYTCEYRPSVSGLYYISISLAGTQLPESPYSVQVLAPCADPDKCVVHGDGLRKVTAREPSSFQVDFKDALTQITHAEELDVFVLPRAEGPAEPQGPTEEELAEMARLQKLAEEQEAARLAAEAYAQAEAEAAAAAAAAAEAARIRRRKMEEKKKQAWSSRPGSKPGNPPKPAAAPAGAPAAAAPTPAPAPASAPAVEPPLGSAAPATPAPPPELPQAPTATPMPPAKATAAATPPPPATPGSAPPKAAAAAEEMVSAVALAAPLTTPEPASDAPRPRRASEAASQRSSEVPSSSARDRPSARGQPASREQRAMDRLAHEFQLAPDSRREFRVAQTSPTEVMELKSYFRDANEQGEANAAAVSAYVAEDPTSKSPVRGRRAGAGTGTGTGGLSRSPKGVPSEVRRRPRDLASWSGRREVDGSLSPTSRREAVQEHRLGEILNAVMKVPASATPAEAAAAASAASPRSPKGTAGAQEAAPSKRSTTTLAAMHPKLDGAERQRQLRLWNKQLADEQSRIKAEAHAKRMLGQRSDQGDEEAMAAIRAAAAGPSFASEIATEGGVSPRSRPHGFAYGGLFPGTIHAHGKLVESHQVSFAVGRAGCYYLHVALRSSGLPLPGSPFELKVFPGHAHALSTRLPTDALPLRTVVGETGSLILHAADRVGNLCAAGGDPLGAVEPTHHVECTTKDLADGRYQISWNAKVSGSYHLHITVGGSLIYGSPVDLTMLPANPDVGMCACTGTGLQRALAGRFAYLRVKSRDRYSNPTLPGLSMKFGLCAIPAVTVTNEPVAAVAAVEGAPAGAPAAEDAEKKATVTGAAKPKYTDEEIYGVTKAAAAAALAEFERQLEELKASQQFQRQQAAEEASAAAPAADSAGAPADAKKTGATKKEEKKDEKKEEATPVASRKSTAGKKGGKGGKDGDPKESADEAKAKAAAEKTEAEAAAAKATAEANAANARLQQPPTEAKAATVPSMDFDGVWRPGGEYEIRYMWKEAGYFDLHIWCDVNGDGERQRLPGSPFRVYVSAAQPSASGSTIGNTDKAKYGAGEKIDLNPQLRDQFGNPCAIVDRKRTAEAQQSTAAYIMKEMLSQHGAVAKQAILKVADDIAGFSRETLLQGGFSSDDAAQGRRVPGSPELFSRRKGGDALSRRMGTSADMFSSSKDAAVPELTAWLTHPKGTSPLVLKTTSSLGRYEVQNHLLTLKGNYDAHFALNGVPLMGSPVSFQVHAAAPSGKHSYIVAPDVPALVKLPYELTLHAVDKYGNKLTTGGAKVEVKVLGASAPCTVVDHKDGTYSLHFTVNTTGSFHVEVRIDGLKVRGVPTATNFKDTDKEKSVDHGGLTRPKDIRARKHREKASDPNAADPNAPGLSGIDGIDSAGIEPQANTASPVKGKKKPPSASNSPPLSEAPLLDEDVAMDNAGIDDEDAAADSAPKGRASKVGAGSKKAAAGKLGTSLG